MKTFFELSKQLVEAKDEFKPHKMYDPKTGEAYDADTEADHLKYKKMGYTHEKPDVKEAMSPKEKAAHAKAIADFKKKGGKVKKLKPGYAQGWTGKDDFGTGQKGMLNKSDTSKFGTKKRVKSMRAHMENTEHNIEEAFSSWTVTAVKSVNKVKKGDSKTVKAQNTSQALKKSAKAWGDEALNAVSSKYFKVTKESSESIEEGFSPKEIKMAIGIASDPRYKGGNMTGAVRAIDKIKRGLSGHKQVMAVLKRQNEDINEATNIFTDDRVGFQIDRFSMGKDKGVGFQINYGKGIGKGKYIQVPMDDMKRVIAQMTKAMKAKI